MLSELREGRAFAELAQRFADNDPVAEEDGVVGWIGLPHLDWYKVPRAAFLLPVKGTGGPTSTPAGSVADLPFCRRPKVRVDRLLGRYPSPPRKARLGKRN